MSNGRDLLLCLALLAKLAEGGLDAHDPGNAAVHKGLGAHVNWADRLGYGKDNKVLILHADDAGMFPGTNTGIQDLLLTEIQSASVMPPLPYYADMVQWHNALGDQDIGLHLTLNAEWKERYRWGPVFEPPAGVKRILKHKFLFWGWRPYFPGGSFYSWLYRGPNTVEKELQAQIDLAVRGRQATVNRPAIPKMDPLPTHLDSHMGAVFLRKSHFKRYLEVSKASHAAGNPIPALSFRNFEYTKTCFAPAAGDDVLGRLVRKLTDAHVRRLERAQQELDTLTDPWPYPRLDQYCVVPYGNDLATTRDNLERMIEMDLETGITQILFHPSDEDPLLRHSMAPGRAKVRIQIDRELYDMLDPLNPLVDLFNKPEVVFTTWKNMLERYERPSLCANPNDGNPTWVKPSTCPP